MKITVAVTIVSVKHKITDRYIFIALRGVIRYLGYMITHAQIRAARAMIGWKQTDLAKAAGVSEMSIKNIERGTTDSRMSTMQAIQSALESAGIIFIDQNGNGPGVRLRDRQE